MNINYTIIIPHKDIPQLLQRCLASIPQREDLQIIVVDDNSDPTKVDFAHFPGLDCFDVECYFTKEGKGGGYARNVGLKHARGKWLLFADADDFFHDNLLDSLDKWKDSERDIIYFGCDSVMSDTLEPTSSRIYDIRALSRENLFLPDWYVPWGKMLRSDLINGHHILFDEVKYANDVMFSCLCEHYAGENIDKCNSLIYCSTVRADSLVYCNEPDNLITRFRVLISVNKRIRRWNLKCRYKDTFSYLNHENVDKGDYLRMLTYYLIHECFHVLFRDFVIVAKFHLKRIRIKMRLWN